MPIQVPRIVIDMTLDPPRMGATQINFRVITRDKNLIDHAAIAVGLSQAEFLRYVAILAAREIIKERNRVLGEDAPKDGLGQHIQETEAHQELAKEAPLVPEQPSEPNVS